mgnify:CR=1 FL=1
MANIHLKNARVTHIEIFSTKVLVTFSGDNAINRSKVVVRHVEVKSIFRRIVQLASFNQKRLGSVKIDKATRDGSNYKNGTISYVSDAGSLK